MLKLGVPDLPLWRGDWVSEKKIIEWDDVKLAMKKVFIGYSRADISAVDRIVDHIQMSGYDVWIDRQDLSAGDGWREQLVAAIESRDVLFIDVVTNFCTI